MTAYRPIRPTAECKVKIRKDRHPMTDWAFWHPWTVLTRFPTEPGFTQVARFETWARAMQWCERGF